MAGPDLVIEIVSEKDRSREKLPFYEMIGTREVMLIDRNPWAITLYQLKRGDLVEVGCAAVDRQDSLTSSVVPLNWQLHFDAARPVIKIAHQDGVQQWSVSPDVD